jgi:hypothetical protein
MSHVTEKLQTVYANAMLCHPYGYPLYHPASTKSLKLGACGYLDEYGDWNNICNVLEKNPSFDTISEEELERAEPQRMTWLPKVSENVHEVKLKAQAAV